MEIVAWCDDEGCVCVAGAFCPHPGSHMGPTVGGLVRDGCLVCPFHGFQFDTTGRCVATPNAPAPKAAKLTVHETTEILGMVFAWWGGNGRPPQWHLPDGPSTGTVVHVHGLGYSFVEIREKKIGMNARMWVLATPVDGTRIALTLATQVREIRKPGRFFAGLGFLPTRFRHGLLSRFFLSEERVSAEETCARQRAAASRT